MIQVTVTENNDWEGETFLYVLQVNQEKAQEISEYFSREEFQEDWFVELNTDYTPEKVELLNEHSDNTYMDYIGFYKIPEGREISDELFYKAAGLERV